MSHGNYETISAHDSDLTVVTARDSGAVVHNIDVATLVNHRIFCTSVTITNQSLSSVIIQPNF